MSCPSSKCDGCATDCDTPKPKIVLSKKPIQVDMNEFMQPLPKPKQDGTDLNSVCKHYPYGKIQRYQCEECINEWVQAHDDDTIIKWIEIMHDLHRKIAADRIEQAFKEKKHKRRIE